MFFLNKSWLEEIVLIYFVSDEWMILKKILLKFFVLGDTF